MALKGNLSDMATADLIQHNCQDHKTARLVINYNGQEANLYFHEGAVQHATLGKRQGEEVVYELLSWQEGSFSLEMGQEPPAVTINRSWSGLLLTGAQRLDELENQTHTYSPKESLKMSNIQETLAKTMELDGAVAVALVDWESGMTLGTAGGSKSLNIELAAAGNTNVVRSKLEVMKDLKIKGGIEDILITLASQYHMIRPLASNPNLFMYVALNRSQSNLGLARHKLANIEQELVV
ncbi:MAG: DUF4388 domain-containing protein [Chloroflexota bacterium]